MRILIDTNVLISAALSANGTPFQAYIKATSYPNHGLICEQNVDDRPILRAAINAKADILLTGDKDFLESSLENPVIMTPVGFLNKK